MMYDCMLQHRVLSHLPGLQLVRQILLLHVLKEGGVVLVEAELVLHLGGDEGEEECCPVDEYGHTT